VGADRGGSAGLGLGAGPVKGEYDTTLIPRGIESRSRPKLPVAILTHAVLHALQDYRERIRPVSYSPTKQRGTFDDGQEFIIVTREEQLMGARISGFWISGFPDPKLIELAELRMRGQRK
jgi:hypothetical protein